MATGALHANGDFNFLEEVLGISLKPRLSSLQRLFSPASPRSTPVANVPVASDSGLYDVFPVSDLDRSISSIEANGGSLIGPVIRIAGMGRIAYFRDPEGNSYGIMQKSAR